MCLIAPGRRPKVEMPGRHSRAGGRADTSADQGTNNHADRSAYQPYNSARSGAGRGAAGGAVGLGLAASGKQTEQQ